MPECFSDVTLDPVPGHGTADLFTYRNSETWLHQIINLPDNQKSFDNKLVNRTGQPDKVGTLPQTNGLGKRADSRRQLTTITAITWLQCERTGSSAPWPFCA